MTTKYMHLLNGQPASFDERNKYIYFNDKNHPVILVNSLAAIRKHQKIDQEIKSIEWSYSYVRVKV